LRRLFLPDFAAISEALNYDSFLEDLSNLRVSTDSFALRFVYRFASLRFQQSLEFYTSFFRLVNSSFVALSALLAANQFLDLAAVISRAHDYSTSFSASANAAKLFVKLRRP
jgi:hypothetical protein